MSRAIAVAHNERGVALLDSAHSDEAVAAFRLALAIDTTLASAAYNLGRALLEAGDLNEARTWLERAIEIEPANGSFYLPLIHGGFAQMQPGHVEAVVRLSAQLDSLPHAQRVDLHFALGYLYERRGRIADAFEHLRAGNALRRAHIVYDESAEGSFRHSIQEAFGNPVMESARGCGDRSERPVFIFGMPRSGSTLVEQVLAAHPQVDAAGEISVLGSIVRESASAMAPATVAELRAAIRGIGDRYLRATDVLVASGTRLTDKTLYNTHFAPLISVMLPNARMIHVRRDALDTCFSCFGTTFAHSQVPFSYDLGELGRYYRAYAGMMARWSALIPADRLLEVTYERFVGNFESEARRVVAFCGLEWDPACLNFHAVRRPVRTASNVQVRRPLYSDSIGRARSFRPQLAPLIEAMGGYPGGSADAGAAG